MDKTVVLCRELRRAKGSRQPGLLDNKKRGYTTLAHADRSYSRDRQRGALLIAASLIAAIRLRGERITQSPKVVATISDSIKLARMVLQRINGERQ